MEVQRLHRVLSEAMRFDLMFNTPAVTDKGFKLSLQGKGVQDAIFLYRRLIHLLYGSDVPFKVGTARRFALEDQEQSKKVMTIYVPDHMDHIEFAELVYARIMDYKGWYDIKVPTSYEHYAGGIYYRCDRDERGIYIPAK